MLAAFLLVVTFISVFPVSPQIYAAHQTQFNERYQDLRFGFLSNLLAGGANPADSFKQWLAKYLDPNAAFSLSPSVTRIEIFPKNVTRLYVGQKLQLSAVAFDATGAAVSGTGFMWKSRDVGRNLPERQLLNALYEGRRPGIFEIKAATVDEAFTAAITVEVAATPAATLASGVPSANESPERNELNDPRNGRYFSSRQESPPSAVLLGNPDWDDEDIGSADDFGNRVGTPPGGLVDGGASDNNFNLAAPIISLPGRGLDLNLNLVYNSRVWSKSGSEMKFDADRGFPAPGWTLGFGKIVHTGTRYGQCMLVSGDGTRHSFEGNALSSGNQPNRWTSYYYGRTTDGSFNDYSCIVNYDNQINYLQGIAKFADGTEIYYNALNSTAKEAYPTLIKDRSGNFLTITYRNGIGPNIETITDTLGRTIRFQYNGNGQLSHITAPKLGGGEQEIVRLAYRPHTLAYAFQAGYTAVVRGQSEYFRSESDLLSADRHRLLVRRCRCLFVIRNAQ